MRVLLILASLFLFVNCAENPKKLDAQQIIDKAIEISGGKLFEEATVSFTFRDTKYKSTRKNGKFNLSRHFKDSIGEVKDELTNVDFQRYVNSVKINLPDSTAAKYANSVNSVHYFIQLPYGLNALAVIKELAGEVQINGKDYFKIKVTFQKDGGGLDHEDEFLYLIDRNDFTVDYFAYKYFTGEGGIRFRKAINPRTISGIRFVDYENYKVEPWKDIKLNTVDSLYDKGKLELLSTIKNEDVKVEF